MITPKTRMFRDLYFVVIFLFTAAILMYIDKSNIVILQGFLIGVFLVAGTHLTRRLLFHTLDLQLIARKACEEPLGAGMVFMSIMGFLVSVMWLGIAVVR